MGFNIFFTAHFLYIMELFGFFAEGNSAASKDKTPQLNLLLKDVESE